MAIIRKALRSAPYFLAFVLFVNSVYATPPPSVESLLQAIPVLEPRAGDNEPFDAGVRLDSAEISFRVMIFHDGTGGTGMLVLDGLDNTPLLYVRPDGDTLAYELVSGELRHLENARPNLRFQAGRDAGGVGSIVLSFAIVDAASEESALEPGVVPIRIDVRSLFSGLEDLHVVEEADQWLLVGRTADVASTITAAFVDDDGLRMKGVQMDDGLNRLFIVMFSHGESFSSSLPLIPWDAWREEGYLVVAAPSSSEEMILSGAKVFDWMSVRSALRTPDDEVRHPVIDALGLDEEQVVRLLERDERIAAELRELLAF